MLRLLRDRSHNCQNACLYLDVMGTFLLFDMRKSFFEAHSELLA